MHIQIGVDIIGVQRIQEVLDRWGERFLQRVFTERERRDTNGRIESLAGRFAAKEAVLKALGTGLTNGICWRDVEIIATSNGPRVCLYGEARRRARELRLDRWSISITHSDGFAAAVAVGYGEQNVSPKATFHEDGAVDGHRPAVGVAPSHPNIPSRQHVK